MSNLLYIEASPRKTRSKSIEVAQAFIHAYKDAYPSDRIQTLDLWNYDLPPFDGDTLDAKYAVLHGKKHTAEQARSWQRVEEIFQQFSAADAYLISTPMWNYNIPYKFKHYIDVITQPGLAFTVSATGQYQGQVTGKPVAVIYARGGEYGTKGQEAWDFQKPYVELWLKFIGFTDIHHILVEPTIGDPQTVDQALSAAKELATITAQNFYSEGSVSSVVS